MLAGHTDTVPANGNAAARIEGDTLWGLGAADMKGGLAVMLELAAAIPEPAVDVTYVFYAGEEVAAEHNGLGHLFAIAPTCWPATSPCWASPPTASVEAGCQGTLRVEVTLRGARAHTARPWMGRNAIHRLGAVLRRRRGLRSGASRCSAAAQFREALQAVAVEGGVAGNVVPDRATRHAQPPLRPGPHARAEAEAAVRALLAAVLEDGDELRAGRLAAGRRARRLDHPLLRALVERNDLPVRAKLGWTDVARFAAHGIPAANFGPGDATLAHTADERVERPSVPSLDDCSARGRYGDAPCVDRDRGLPDRSDAA